MVSLLVLQLLTQSPETPPPVSTPPLVCAFMCHIIPGTDDLICLTPPVDCFDPTKKKAPENFPPTQNPKRDTSR